MLLDPVKKADVRLIDVQDDGRMGPSRICIGSARLRVERSIELYGLNLPRLKAARLRVMREVNDLHSVLSQMLESAPPAAECRRWDAYRYGARVITSKTLPSSAYSKAARVQLMRLPGGPGVVCAARGGPEVNSAAAPVRRLFFYRMEYSQLVRLERYLGIKGLASL